MPKYTYHNQQYDFQGRAIGPVGVFENATVATAVARYLVYTQPEIMHVRISRCREHTYDFNPYMMVYMNIVTDKATTSRRKVF